MSPQEAWRRLYERHRDLVAALNSVSTGSVGTLDGTELQQAAGFLHAATRLIERLEAARRAPSVYPPRPGLRLVIDNTINDGGTRP